MVRFVFVSPGLSDSGTVRDPGSPGRLAHRFGRETWKTVELLVGAVGCSVPGDDLWHAPTKSTPKSPRGPRDCSYVWELPSSTLGPARARHDRRGDLGDLTAPGVFRDAFWLPWICGLGSNRKALGMVAQAGPWSLDIRSRTQWRHDQL